MQVGNATISVGSGAALLTLPDAGSLLSQFDSVNSALLQDRNFSESLDEEIGWNVNGSIAIPVGAGKSVSLNGFWVNINDSDRATCSQDFVGADTWCAIAPLTDIPGIAQASFDPAPQQTTTTTDRVVDQWALSLETTRALSPKNQYFALGADIRGINQDLDVLMQY